VPTLIGGDFNVIPEDIDCHKPSSWEHDALFQPEPRARYRAMLGIAYTDAFRSLHVGEIGHFTFWDSFGKRSRIIEVYESITFYYLQRWQIDWKAARSIKDREHRKSRLTTPP
jgi:hypothetical protein